MTYRVLSPCGGLGYSFPETSPRAAARIHGNQAVLGARQHVRLQALRLPGPGNRPARSPRRSYRNRH